MASIHLDILCDQSPQRRKVDPPSSVLHSVITISSSFSVNNLNLIDSRPKDVIFVVDKSGSMEGPRMDRSKAAINHVIDALLAPMDRIGVVAFSSSVSIISSLDFATDIPTLHNRVNNIVAEGGTNIHQGLLEALHQFDHDVTTDPTRQRLVILLSDGEHNEGPLVISEFSSLCSQKQLSGVFCIGIDEQADIKTLSIIASECHGQFWSTNNLETLQQDLIRSFSKCFCGILSSLGKNVILRIENLLPNQVGKLVYSDFSNSFKMSDSSVATVTGEDGSSTSIIEINIGQLISEQTIHLILGFDIPSSSSVSSVSQKDPILKFSLDYYDLFEHKYEKIEKLVSWPLSFTSPIPVVPVPVPVEEKVPVEDHRYRLVFTKEDNETHDVDVISEEMISLGSDSHGYHLHVPSDLIALLYLSSEKCDDVIEFHPNSSCLIERVPPLTSSTSASSSSSSNSSDGYIFTLLEGKYYVNVNSYEIRIYDEKDIFSTSFSSLLSPPPPGPISATPTATISKKGHVVSSSASSLSPHYLFLLSPSLAVAADKAAAASVAAVSPAASAKPKVVSSILSPSSFTSTSSAAKKHPSITAVSISASGPRQNKVMIIEKQSKLRAVCLTGLIKVFEKKKEVTTVPAFEEITFLAHSSSSSSISSHSPPATSLTTIGRPKALSSAVSPSSGEHTTFQKLKEISKDHINDLLTSHLLRNDLIIDSCENHYLVRNCLKEGFYSLCTNFNPNMIKEYEEILNNVLKTSFSYKLERMIKIPEISQNIALVKAFTVSTSLIILCDCCITDVNLVFHISFFPLAFGLFVFLSLFCG
jgi:uncharacterized protein YegL